MDEKRPFVANTAADAEWRSMNALEFIAHYLDRMESHLEKISGQLEPLQKLALQVQQINQKTK